MKPNAAQDIVSYVMDRLASGLYPPGCRLPTSRELAAELGVHRNTVAKAYKSLVDLGLVSSTPGRGTFAAARLDVTTGACTSSRSVSGWPRTSSGHAAAISVRMDLRQTIAEHIATIYHAPPPRGAFVECNAEDLRVAIAEIEQQSDVRLAPLLLDALAGDPAGVAASLRRRLHQPFPPSGGS